jgi:hypothetical protein
MLILHYVWGKVKIVLAAWNSMQSAAIGSFVMYFAKRIARCHLI